MLTLYYSEKSCSYAPHILLYDTGADFVAKRIDFGTGEQNSEGYLSVNPKGRVPALMTPDGVLTEIQRSCFTLRKCILKNSWHQRIHLH